MPHPLAGVSPALTGVFGRAATYTPRGGSGTPVTPRFQGANTVPTKGRTQQRIATTCDIYLDYADVAARPQRGATVECTDASPWAGTWTLIADGDPKPASWRCAAVREDDRHTIAQTAGDPRPGGG